jgi:hypothetical protein
MNKINVLSYNGKNLTNEINKDFIMEEFIELKEQKMKEKSERRLLYGKQQIDRLTKTNKQKTSVQVRNYYEAKIICEYALSIGLLANTYESEDLITNNIKQLTIRLGDSNSEHSKSECSCARTEMKFCKIQKKVIYVLVKKNTHDKVDLLNLN